MKTYPSHKIKQPLIDPNFQRALVSFEAGRPQEAAMVCESILQKNPKHVDALHLMGVMLSNNKQYIQALGFFNEALNLHNKNAVMYNNRANLFIQLKQVELAMDDFEKSLAINPKYAEAYYNRGIAFDAINKTEEAIEQYTLALKYRPAFPEALNNRGIALQKLHRMEETLANYNQAIKLNPNMVEAFYNNRGLVLQNLMRIDEALADYDKAIEIKPDLEDARFNRSMCLLLKGNYEKGWSEHEWRFKRNTYPRRHLPGLLWLGKEDIKGKSIFIHGEQGLGDMLQFCRYATLAADMGARVILGVEKPLARLAKTLKGVDQIVVTGDQLPAFDYQTPILSLPLAFKTTVDTIPNQPYLTPFPEDVEKWAKKMGPKNGKLRVGIVWSGGYRPDQPEVWAVNERRNIELEKLKPLQLDNVELYSLQKGEPAESELADSIGWESLINFTSEFGDFADTAAFIQNLDLVIAVDTSTAHVAGAIGKPVWMLNRFDTCWRWLMDRTDSPWYPTFKIYRQPKLGDWDSVVENVRKDLHDLCNIAKENT